MFLKDLLGGQVDFDILNDQLEDIQTELESDCNVMKGEISTLKALDETIEKQITMLQKEEENGSNEYKNKINSLKNELESKEFTIQNMERLYIELEDVIKDNIQKGNDQLLTMEQFNNFLNQNVRLKDEIKQLEIEKVKLDEKYSQVLKENVMLRKNDEEYDKQRIEEILKSYDKEKNKSGKEEALKKINEYKNKQQKLNNEYNNIAEKIDNLILNLKGLNIESKNFNDHLNNIKSELLNSELELYQTRIRYKSISHRKMKLKKYSNSDNNNLIRMQINVFIPSLGKHNKNKKK
jgi:chromosome segregation ATPase